MGGVGRPRVRRGPWPVAVGVALSCALVFLAGTAVAGVPVDPALDPSFGGDGRVTTDFQREEVSFDLDLQPDGKAVAVGDTGPFLGPRDFALARYNPDGSLDTSFGADGRVSTPFGTGRDDTASSLAIQANGKIVVAGSTASGDDSDFAVARYDADGASTPASGVGTGW